MTTPPKPEDMTREDLELGICVELSFHPWHDITEECNPDPEAVQCLAAGYKGKGNGDTIWMLTRYEDDKDRFALVCNMRGEVKRVGMEQYKLQWLWEKVAG